MAMLTEWMRYPTPLKVWLAFIVLFPFYFFKSGLPQIADWILACLLFYELSNNKTPLLPQFVPAMRALKWFAVYTLIVSACWWPFVTGYGYRAYVFYLYPIFYIYNAMVVWLALKLYSRFGGLFLRSTLVAITLCVLLQLVLVPIAGGDRARGTLFFNNPNQLGYFTLMALSIFLYAERYASTNLLIKSAVFGGTFVFAGISVSKAALISAALLVVVNLLDSGALRAKQFFGGLAAVGVLVVGVMFTPIGKEYLERAATRLGEIGTDEDDKMALRGYDRIWNYPEYTLLGAAEGGWQRFYRDPRRRYEMHSSFGTIIFSYGIPGSVLFALFIYHVFRGAGYLSLLYAAPIFVYGITHMGLRFTLFWVFFALALTAKDFRQLQQRNARRAAPQEVPRGNFPMPQPNRV